MIESIEQAITGFLQHNNNPAGLALLGVAALVEYVFPPFPGDTITLFGAFLVTRYAWNIGLVFGVVMLGSAVGAMADYYAGVWMGRRYRAGGLLKSAALRARVDGVIAAFQRHGEAYIVLNRFLPAVRAVFFLAAGMARLRPLHVLLYAMVSAAAWNALIIGAGYAVGANWGRITSLFRTYTIGAWIALGIAAACFTIRWLLRRRRRRETPSDGEV